MFYRISIILVLLFHVCLKDQVICNEDYLDETSTDRRVLQTFVLHYELYKVINAALIEFELNKFLERLRIYNLKLGQVPQFLDNVPTDLKGKRVLEIGAGIGALARKLYQGGIDITVVEPDQSYCAFMRDYDPIPSNRVMNARLQDLDHSHNKQYDVVLYSLFSVAYKERNEFFSRLREILKPNGIANISFASQTRFGDEFRVMDYNGKFRELINRYFEIEYLSLQSCTHGCMLTLKPRVIR